MVTASSLLSPKRINHNLSQVPTVGGQQQQNAFMQQGDAFMQTDGGSKFHQQPGQDQQGGFYGSIPITAQAGVIDEGDGMED